MDAIVEPIRELVGDDLRAVVHYHDDREYDYLYTREDIDDSYTEERLDKIIDDFVLRGFGSEYVEDLFLAGPLRSTIYALDEAFVCHFVKNDLEGLVVSVDTDTDSDLDRVIDRCEARLS